MDKVIKCPGCGCEYLPAEIYDPNHFLGKPKNIVRSRKGELLGYEGLPMSLSEEFVCDSCGLSFEVFAKINFFIGRDEDTKEVQEEVLF